MLTPSDEVGFFRAFEYDSSQRFVSGIHFQVVVRWGFAGLSNLPTLGWRWVNDGTLMKVREERALDHLRIVFEPAQGSARI